MPLSLKPKEVCPFSNKCPYSNSTGSYCRGTDSTRNTVFSCDFVNNDGIFLENKFRNKLDENGRMRIIHE